MEALPLHCIGCMLHVHFFPLAHVASGGKPNATTHIVGNKLGHRFKSTLCIHMLRDSFHEPASTEHRPKGFKQWHLNHNLLQVWLAWTKERTHRALKCLLNEAPRCLKLPSGWRSLVVEVRVLASMATFHLLPTKYTDGVRCWIEEDFSPARSLITTGCV